MKNIQQTPPPTPQMSPTVASTQTLRPAIVGQFLAVVLIWSLTPLAAVWTVQDIHWAWGLFLRFSLALVLAIALMYYKKLAFPLHREAIYSYLAGALGLFGSMTLCYIGAQYVPSALISMIYGFAPLISGLMCFVLFKSAKLSLQQGLGLMIAIIGLCFALGMGDPHLKFSILGISLEFAAVLLYVISALLVGKFGSSIHPITQMTGATLFSWLGYLCILPFFNQMPAWLNLNPQAYIALVYSAVGSSVLAMVCYYSLIKHLKTNTLMLITIITPMIAAYWGVYLNHEVLGTHFFIGLAVVCIGLALYVYSKPTKKSA